MGLNISVYQLSGTRPYNGKEEPNWIANELEKGGFWDSYRYSGDVEFTTQVDFVSRKQYPDERDSDWMQRPKNFAQAREWVKANVYEGNQARLLEAFDEFEKNENLYFYFGW